MEPPTGEDMVNEFDEDGDCWVARHRPAPAGREGKHASVPRLVARLYGVADAPLRARLLACLLRPLGTLSLAAVAAGAFAGFVGRSRARDIMVAIDDVARFSSEQILDLARFVEQVNPEAMHQVSSVLSENAFGLAAFSASVALLLVRRLRPGTGDVLPVPDGNVRSDGFDA